MSDFMREVDEEYRRERVVRFLSRYQILIAAGLVAIIVGAGVWRFTVDRRIAAAEADNERYEAAERQARAGNAAAAREAYDALAADGVAGYPLLARLRSAEERAGTDPEAAAKSFDEIASGETGGQALRDTARYRGALLRVDHEDPKKFEEQYGRFALNAFTFHDGMRELLALSALKRNDAAAAERYFGEIIVDGSAPGALRNRAQAFLELARSGAASVSDKPAPPATVTPVGADHATSSAAPGNPPLSPSGGATAPSAPSPAAAAAPH